MGMEFIKLVVGQTGASQVSVACQVETARYFGWDTAFPEWKPRWSCDGIRSTTVVGAHWNRDIRRHGGDRRRICRDPSKKGWPAGKTHAFRMIGPWSRRDLVELARVAGDKFEWMEDKRYKRIDRSVWLSLAERKKPPGVHMHPSDGGR